MGMFSPQSIWRLVSSTPFHKALASVVILSFFSYILSLSLNPLAQPLVIQALPNAATFSAIIQGQIMPILGLIGLIFLVIFICGIVDILHMKKLKLIQYLIISLLIFIFSFAFSLITPISFILFNPFSAFVALFAIVYIVAWLIDF